ncbi:cytochrome-c peroxidase [Crenobacter caeni]|uniref:Methylamine utilization protein MauG n=1 Tax=Crenobacter caeni TaxID=2705474 RepID=A0A6B2KT62_9NEIS|nr:cytochrome c peroxidase [Crenobacter caeni]NDV13436.1 c-type cytochrome [Crenobacter caeni]
MNYRRASRLLLPAGLFAALASSSAIAAPATDVSILATARAIFAPLPASAPNPDNPVTPDKVVLGKQLFFDARLSKGGTVSCNSCHNLATYGVDNLSFSMGHKGQFGGRNSPSVLNAALLKPHFWDGRAKDAEEQAKGPIMNPVEMAIPHEAYAVERIASIPEYRTQFARVFPGDKQPVSYDNIAKAIAAFERTLLTPAPFDAWLKGDAKALSAQQVRGAKTFIDKGCVACHAGATLGGDNLFKFGLVQGPYSKFTGVPNKDAGVYDISKKEADRDVFRTPSLRNVARTYPYFHDGSVWQLDQAIRVMSQTQLGLKLTDNEVADVQAFLESLTGTIPASALQLPVLPASTAATSKPDNS